MNAPQTVHLPPSAGFPNSAHPALLYCAALPADPAAMEHAFDRQDWLNPWRNGIYTYHHFHSTAHEVLGIAAGHVHAMLGGPSGQQLTLHAGDVLVIPAGVGHCNLGQSDDLLVIGATAGGAPYDVLRGHPAELAAATSNIAQLGLPAHDPVPGAEFLRALWAGHAA